MLFVASWLRLDWWGVLAAMATAAVVPLSIAAWVSPPDKTHPQGPITDSGRWLGHDWVSTDHVEWVDAATADALRRAPVALDLQTDISGFTRTAAPATLAIPSEAIVQRATLWATLGWILTVLVLALSDLADGTIDPQDVFSFTFVVSLGVLLFSTVTNLILMRVVETVLRQWSSRTSGGTVQVEGLQVRSGEQRFTLGHPDQVLALLHDARGARLECSNPKERLMLRGSHSDLAQIRAALELAARPSGSDAEVPPQLARLKESTRG